tara:strand:+ start:60 stop:362 length:303 start_codon:yes stop_codon:yes gene_type:complete
LKKLLITFFNLLILTKIGKFINQKKYQIRESFLWDFLAFHNLAKNFLLVYLLAQILYSFLRAKSAFLFLNLRLSLEKNFDFYPLLQVIDFSILFFYHLIF